MTTTLCLTAPAWAQEPSHDEAMKDAAASIFEDARKALREQDYPTCYARAKAAWGIHEHVQIAAIAADCGGRVGEHLEAARFAARALLGLDPDKQQIIVKRMGEVLAEAKTHVVSVDLSVEPAGAKVWLDDAPLSLGGTVYVAPGSHTLRVTAEGYEPHEESWVAVSGETKTLAVELRVAGGNTGDGPPLPPDGESSSIAVPLAIGIVGGVLVLGAVGTGIGLRVAAGGEADDAAAAREALPAGGCTVDPAACDRIDEALGSKDTLANGSTIALIGAGVLAVATVVGVIVTLPDDAEISLHPVVGPNVGGVSFAISW